MNVAQKKRSCYRDIDHGLRADALGTIAPHVHYYKCDITSPATIHEVAERIRKEVGAPTVLINNAGVARGKTILDSVCLSPSSNIILRQYQTPSNHPSQTEKDIRFTFEVNTFAHYWIAHEFLPSLIQNNHGMVVTVASLAAYMTVPDMVDYASSKAAAMSFHEGLTAELTTRFNAPKVRTVMVNQGYTKTPLFKGYNSGSAFLVPALEPQTVAEGIVRKVLSGSSGQIILPGFGATVSMLRALPHWYQNRTRAQGEKFMKAWDGRQVIDVNKWQAGGKKQEEKSDESASTVLVPKAE